MHFFILDDILIAENQFFRDKNKGILKVHGESNRTVLFITHQLEELKILYENAMPKSGKNKIV